MTEAIITNPTTGQRAKVTFDTQDQLDAVVKDFMGQSAPNIGPGTASRADLEAQQAADRQRDNSISGQVQDILARHGEAIKGIMRTIGQTGRNIAQGGPALLGLVTDAPGKTYEAITGNQAPYYAVPYRSYFNSLDSPQIADTTPTERVVSDVERSMAGTMGSMGIGGTLAGTSSPVTQGVGQTLQAAPSQQLVSSAASSGASGVTREAGGGPIAQTMAGIVAGIGAPLAVEGAKAVGRGIADTVGSFTQKGRETAAGQVLNQSASNPVSAKQNMAGAQQIVPGSEPTAAEVAGDYGITKLQKTVQNSSGADFANRFSEQNTARNNLLDKVAGGQTPDATLQKLIDNREAATSTLRNNALSAAPAINNQDILTKIDAMLADPNNAGAGTQKLLQSARSQIEDKTNATALYAVRKDIGKALQTGFDSNQAPVVYAAGQLRDVQKAIDSAISDVSPTWDKYLARYSQLSKPIDRLTAIMEARAKSTLAAPDNITGLDVLSQAKFKNQVANLADSKLTPAQSSVLDRVNADLARNASRNDANIRVMGSDTAQNQQDMQELGNLIKNNLASKVPIFGKFADWLTSLNESKIQGMIKDGLLNPQQGAKLMDKAQQIAAQRAATQPLSMTGATLGTAQGVNK